MPCWRRLCRASAPCSPTHLDSKASERWPKAGTEEAVERGKRASRWVHDFLSLDFRGNLFGGVYVLESTQLNHPGKGCGFRDPLKVSPLGVHSCRLAEGLLCPFPY